jgi:hypothetical protein
MEAEPKVRPFAICLYTWVNFVHSPIRGKPQTEAFVPFHFLDLKMREWLKLFGPFLALIVFGFVGRFAYRNCWPWSDLAFGLFDAVMIAGFLGIGLELYSTKILIERVADDLTEKLVGRGLPPELQSLILKVTKTTIVRDQFVKTYSLGVPQNGHVTLDRGGGPIPGPANALPGVGSGVGWACNSMRHGAVSCAVANDK